jgi:hypothetical protein
MRMTRRLHIERTAAKTYVRTNSLFK